VLRERSGSSSGEHVFVVFVVSIDVFDCIGGNEDKLRPSTANSNLLADGLSSTSEVKGTKLAV
jgi:hypothetical protein